MSEKIFKLSKPIKVHQEGVGAIDLTELRLREPTAGDVFDLESPTTQKYSTDGTTVDMKVSGPALKAWLTRLSGYSGGELGAMEAADLHPITTWLNGRLNNAEPGN